MNRFGYVLLDRALSCAPLDQGRIGGNAWALRTYLSVSACKYTATLLTNAGQLAGALRWHVETVRDLQQQLKRQRLIYYPTSRAHGPKCYWIPGLAINLNGETHITREWTDVLWAIQEDKQRDRLLGLLGGDYTPCDISFKPAWKNRPPSVPPNAPPSLRGSDAPNEEHQFREMWKTFDKLACTLLDLTGPNWVDDYLHIFSRKSDETKNVKNLSEKRQFRLRTGGATQ